MNHPRTIELCRKCAFPALLLALALFVLFPSFPNGLRWPGRILFFAALAVGFTGLAVKSFRNPKHFIFSCIAILLGCLITYGFLELVALFYLKSDPDRNANPFVLTEVQREAIENLVKGEPDYTAFDSTLGWAIKKNGVSADGRYRANSQGFRANRDYATEKPAGITRAICFGDSYTHGNSVTNEETWQHYAEAGQENWEFLNFGVGAAGMAQAYLRYRDFKDAFETDFVVIGCMTDNIRRTVNVYYPFRLNRLDATSFALAKPWASLNSSGELVFHPNPLPSLEAYESFLAAPEKAMREMAKQDLLFENAGPTPLWTVAGEKIANADFDFLQDRLNYLLNRDPTEKKPRKKRKPSPFDPENEIFRINCQLFQEFVEEVKAGGAKPVILWFPSPKDVDRYNDRGTRIYETFLQFFNDNDLPVLDSLDWIAETYGIDGKIPAETVFLEGHYASPVNELIGERLGDFLKSQLKRGSSSKRPPAR